METAAGMTRHTAHASIEGTGRKGGRRIRNQKGEDDDADNVSEEEDEEASSPLSRSFLGPCCWSLVGSMGPFGAVWDPYYAVVGTSWAV